MKDKNKQFVNNEWVNSAPQIINSNAVPLHLWYQTEY